MAGQDGTGHKTSVRRDIVDASEKRANKSNSRIPTRCCRPEEIKKSVCFRSLIYAGGTEARGENAPYCKVVLSCLFNTLQPSAKMTI